MKRLGQSVLVLTIIALAAPTAFAQRGQRGGGGGAGFFRDPLVVAGQTSVQEELKLSEDQIKQISESSKDAWSGLQDLQGEERQKKSEELAQAHQKVVDGILKEGQLKRLKQISLQLRGPFDPETALALKVTSDQQDKAKAIQEESQKEMQALRQGGGGGAGANREEAMKKSQALRKARSEKELALLTPEQTAKWTELTGPQFTGEINFRGGRRRQ